jgi:hypothetical protein
VLLGTVQAIATVMIMVCAIAYNNHPCPVHATAERHHVHL